MTEPSPLTRTAKLWKPPPGRSPRPTMPPALAAEGFEDERVGCGARVGNAAADDDRAVAADAERPAVEGAAGQVADADHAASAGPAEAFAQAPLLVAAADDD